MDNHEKKQRKPGIFLFILYLCIGIAFLGACIYIVVTTRGTAMATDRILTVSKIFALAGLFFFILAFGHILPQLISKKK